MKVSKDAIKMRGFQPENDVSFVVNTWLKSYRDSAPMTSVPNSIYYPAQSEKIKSILMNEDTMVVILCSPLDDTQILGYAVFSRNQPIVHFIYMKFPYRKVGCAQLLLSNIKALHSSSEYLFCTHVAKKWTSKAKHFKLVYDPFLLKGN